MNKNFDSYIFHESNDCNNFMHTVENAMNTNENKKNQNANRQQQQK